MWGILAVIASSYLAMTLTAPQLVGLTGQDTTMGNGFAANGGASKKAVRHLQERLSNAQLEIAKLRTQLSQQEESLKTQQQTAQQVTNSSPAADNEPAMVRPLTTTAILKTAVATAATTDQTIETTATNAASTGLDRGKQTALELQLAKAQIENSNMASKSAQQPSKIETGSLKIPPTPVRAPPPPIKSMRIVGSPKILAKSPPARTPAAHKPSKSRVKVANLRTEPKMGVRLATGPSIDALRLRWTLMLDRAGATLSTLRPRFVQSNQPGALGPTYDLIAGPLNTLSDAQRICNAAAVSSSVCEIRKLNDSKAL